MEAAIDLNMHTKPFHFFGGNIAVAYEAFSARVRNAFDGRLTSALSLPPENNVEMEKLLRFTGRNELKGFEDTVRSRAIAAYVADAIKLVLEAASRERYTWKLGSDLPRTRAALIRGMDSVDETRPMYGPSLGLFSFDENKDVVVNVDQVVLTSSGLVPLFTRAGAEFSGSPSPADVATYLASPTRLVPGLPCDAEPLTEDELQAGAVASDDGRTQILLGAVVGCLVAIFALFLLVLLRQQKKKKARRFNLLAWLKANQKSSAWVPPRLTSDSLKLEERIGEGAYGAVYVGKLTRRPGPYSRFDAQHGVLRDGGARHHPPRPDIPAFRDASSGSFKKQPMSVAVKQLKFLPNKGDYASLMREAMNLSLFIGKHFIVQPIALTLEPQLTLVLENCTYGSLDQLLLRAFMIDRPLTWSLKLRIASQLSRAIDAVHSWKMMHNDIAARNVLITTNFECKLADFGLVRRVDFDPSGPDCPRMPVRWTSPETLRGNFSCANDIWALGVTLWEIAINATGVPYSNMTEIAVIEAVCNNELLPMPANTPPEVASIIKMCWRPAEARPSAADMTVSLFATRNVFDQDTPARADGKRPVSVPPSFNSATGIFAGDLLHDTSAGVEDEEEARNSVVAYRCGFVDEFYEDADDEETQRWRSEASMHQFMSPSSADEGEDLAASWNTVVEDVGLPSPALDTVQEVSLHSAMGQPQVPTSADGKPSTSGHSETQAEINTVLHALCQQGNMPPTRYANVNKKLPASRAHVASTRSASPTAPSSPKQAHDRILAQAQARGAHDGYKRLTFHAKPHVNASEV